MGSNDSLDHEMERTLRDYFAAESGRLQAPADTWARLERRLGRPGSGWFGGGTAGMWRVLTAAAGTAAASAAVVLVFVFMAGRGVESEETATAPMIAMAPAPAPGARQLRHNPLRRLRQLQRQPARVPMAPQAPPARSATAMAAPTAAPAAPAQPAPHRLRLQCPRRPHPRRVQRRGNLHVLHLGPRPSGTSDGSRRSSPRRMPSRPSASIPTARRTTWRSTGRAPDTRLSPTR